uniref:Uncharacterized protein n=1 Tax=Arundo donax TaxID=35708 RepID=A0A0A9H5W0_ARUDO
MTKVYSHSMQYISLSGLV